MSPGHVFISHASKDDAFVQELREQLESHDIAVWVDSRKLRGGAKLAHEINEAIEQARQVIVVLSANTVNSPWVRKEIQKALEVEKQRKDEGYRVAPLLLPSIEPTALALWFDEEPVGVRVGIKVGELSEALPQILAALGERLPDDYEPPEQVAPRSIEELILKLIDSNIHVADGKRRARATATLIYQPADESIPDVESKRFSFTAPFGVIEAEDLRWYLEDFYVWPIGVFIERAARIESQLPRWGQDLFEAALASPVAQVPLKAWQQAGANAEQRFSVFVDSELPDGASDKDQTEAREAASELLSLPWELLHDGRGFLFHGKNPARVRRRLPNRHSQQHRPTELPIRILLVSPRPEEENRIGYFDHRISAKPLIEAVESLGELVTVTVLAPPTFPALEKTLQKAADAKKPFDVVHFDGHGVYDRKVGLGGLCFEDANETEKLEKRAMQLIHAERLAEVMRDHRIPLVFLEACQTAKTEEDPTASVAAKLLEEGVTSIVAMSHSVLVETARRFVKAFYQELAQGKRVGAAMIAGQRELHRDSYRGRVMGAGELRLQDWFVPVLYQEQQDPQLITKLPSKDAQQLQDKQRHLSLGELPKLHHEFQGRSRELLALERLLLKERYAVIRGQGGAGKTTLAAELARWLAQTARVRRAAFVSLEQYADARTALDSIGRQLLPEGENYSVAHYGDDLKQALQPIERALKDRATIIVFDNMESVLPINSEYAIQDRDSSSEDKKPLEGTVQNAAFDTIKELFDLCQRLIDADPATRIIFTSREPLPAPFNNKRCDRPLGALSREDAIALVSEVMKQEGLTPKAEDPGGDPREITDLVEAVNRHARALVLLAREVSRKGVKATTENLHRLMAELDRKHPGDRENSLYASVELSLRRLPPETREQIKVLAVFHGGAQLGILEMMLGAELETAKNIALQLIEVGLAEHMGYGHLRLDPALPSYLLREMSEAEQEEARTRWAEAMEQLTYFLLEQRNKDAELAAQLTLLELPNIMAMLAWAQDKVTAEKAGVFAGGVEKLLTHLGRPQALAEATRVREQAAREAGEWSHARFILEDANIERTLEQGDLPSAYEATQQLLKRSLAMGEDAYPGAKFDLAVAYFMLGRVLKKIRASEAALSQLAEAWRRFQALDNEDEEMVAAVLTESSDCLIELGRWDEAAEGYIEAIKRFEKLNSQRWIAVNKGQLGNARLKQGRYDEALKSFAEARSIFERLGEPGSVAIAWSKTGEVYRNANQFERAEQAFRQSLAINVQQKNRAAEADTLAELGILYRERGRLEESGKCFQQAIDIKVKLQDQSREGLLRRLLADTLIRLQRFDEARRELHRAIKCNELYGLSSQIWRDWGLLYDLEQACDNPQAAAQARQQAIKDYLAYRRAGGQSLFTVTQLCAYAARSIPQGDTTELEKELAEWSESDSPPSFKLMISKLRAIVQGSRESALADDPELEFHDAVELQLLLEALNSQ